MKILILVNVVLIGLMLEGANAQTATNWGNPLYNVQFSISLSNGIMVVGSTNILHCCIRNSSTNNIDLFRATTTLPATLFSITNHSGKFYELQPIPIDSYISAIHIRPGETYQWFAVVQASNNVDAGDYELKGSQWMCVTINTTNNTGGEIVSNPIRVRVRRWYWF